LDTFHPDTLYDALRQSLISQHISDIQYAKTTRKNILQVAWFLYDHHTSNITHWKKSIVLLTVWAIPAIAVSIWNICVVVAKPAINTDRKFVPVNK
jgi:hypothetical protein